MKFYNIFFIVLLFLIFFVNEKYGFISHRNFKNIIKNTIVILPFLTLYLSQNDFIKVIRKKTYKRKLGETTKKMVASNQNWRCNHCKSLLNFTYEIDHIIPLFKGGNNEINNLQALCRNCHGIKTHSEKIK